ncbi:hypothetical protein EG329_011295 [Mollisiaceae sp. DMI_Dod_QoI]|nr:hypothetical protein EG329_011295 [Helotiales sp. DMI_Dod_QoI]
MSRQRYEPVPQRDHREEVIILDSIHNSPIYNYNSGIPNSVSSVSVASSIRTPSIIAPSIPNSPPPSFHTHSSPGTPRPTPSTSTRQGGGISYAELWGVAPSTVGGTETEIGTSNDALATISGLKQRIEWLEESIGKLLIEKDNHVCSTANTDKDRQSRDNCCVTFTDASPDLERLFTQGTGNNCCVQFRKSDAKLKPKARVALVFIALAVFFTMFTVIMVLSATLRQGGNGRGNSPVMYEEDRS